MKNTTTDISDLAAAGLDPAKVDALLDRVKQEVAEGLLPSVQVAIARNGKLGVFETFGDATNDSLYCVFSATKAITAAAAWLLIQDGKLDISRKVSEIVPEFATNDKQDITIEQLFTHTAGFPNASFRPSDWLKKETRNTRYASWKLEWKPGTRYEYHPTSGMWVIAEIIERLTNQSFTDFIRNRIALPLALPDLWVGCPESEHSRVTEVMIVGDPLTSEDYAKLGIPEPPVTEVTETALTNFNNSDVRNIGVPGGGGIMSAADLAMFYQGLVGNTPGSAGIWSTETLEFAREVRTGDLKDRLTNTPIHRALGICVAGDKRRNMRGFGHTNSPLSFGHAGAGGQIGWIDPETGISIGYCTNGHDRNGIRQARRSISISNKAAVCSSN
jgi:CubicO group peptidase (beta-lactamase class C family)